jgi:choline transport protein
VLINAFSNSWSALAGVLIVGIGAGGPAVMIYSWIGVCIVTLAVAYSLAEMCSAYPVNGGQYSWVALLAPPRIARELSWVTGWFMITGIVAMGATNNFIGANFILGTAKLSHSSYVIERWHTVLVSYLIAILATGVNIFMPRLLNRISTAALCWNVLSFFVVIITILSTNKQKQSSSFVWKVSIFTSPSLHRVCPMADFPPLPGLPKLHRVWSCYGCYGRAATVIFRHVLL